MTQLIQARDLKREFKSASGAVQVLKGISFDARPGEFISIMGPSGSGKSTLLQIVGGLDRPTSGNMIVNGQDIGTLKDDELARFRRRKLGFIFQFFNLIPTLSAAENVAMPLMLDGQSFGAAEPRALGLLDYMGLKSRAHHRPHQLSGGEMQRVAIARALVTDPALVLADEATGNLDSKTGQSVLELLQRLVKEKKLTLILVTHDAKAAEYGTRTIRMRDGLIETDGV